MARKPRKLPKTIKPSGIAPLAYLASLGSEEDGGSIDDDLLGIDGTSLVADPTATSDVFDIEELFDSVQKDINSFPADLKFDDTSMPLAANFYEWTTGKEFLAAEPYLEQVLIGIRLFAEYCPKCSDEEWMLTENHEPQEGIAGMLKHVTLLKHGVCPKCGAHRAKLVRSKKLKLYTELGCCAGQRSGKSILTAMLSSYATHRHLKMQRPTKVYGVGDNQIFHGTFVALTKEQAKDTLWEPYYGYLLASPWFQRYHALMKRYETVYGVDIVKIRDTFVLYRHRNLLVYAAGPDKRVLRGRCVTGSTMINTNQGFLHFNELVTGKPGFKKARDLLVDSHKGTRRVSHTYKDHSKTIKVTTRNGYSIEGTPEHPMLVVTRDLDLVWRRLDDMRVGDYIISRTDRNTPIFGTQQVDRDVATLAGYLVANGFRNTISSDDPDVISNIYRAFENVTGHHVETTPGEVGVRASTHKLSIKGNRRIGGFISTYLKPIGYSDVGSAHKSIPIGIRCASAEILHEFLESYFQCDSGINGGSTKSSKSNAPCEIEIGSASKRLAQQLHIILLQVYGIVGRLRTHVWYDKLDRKTGAFNAKRSHHLITITGGDAWKFLTAFKRAKVQKYADRFRDVPLGYMSDRRDVPYVREYSYGVMESARKVCASGKRLRKYVAADGTEFSWPNSSKPAAFKHIRGSHALSNLTTPEFLVYSGDWEHLIQLMHRINPEAACKLSKLIALGAHYEEVTIIEHRSREKLVYDITVPKGHAFTANGLASHNTRIFYGVDEIGWFDNDAAKNKVKTGAKEVCIALERSCLTVRAATRRLLNEGMDLLQTAYAFYVSSPSDTRDKICELLRQSKESTQILGIHAPTWKMNPNITRDDPTIVEEYRKDPVAAERDYGAVPPVSANPFMSPATVIEAMRTVGRNEIITKQLVSRRKVGNNIEKTMYGIVSKIKESSWPSIMGIDAGETNNSFAMSVVSTRDNKVSIDILAEVMPQPGIPLNYTMIFDQLILPICQKRNVKILLADRWNSTKLLQDALAVQLVEWAKKYSLKYSDMWDVKNMMMSGGLTLPRSLDITTPEQLISIDTSEYPACFDGKPVEHFMYQCITIQDSGSQVLKGPSLTDDLWRASALAVWGNVNPEYIAFMQQFYHKEAAHVNRDPQRLMVLRSGNPGVGTPVASRAGQVGNIAGVLKTRPR